MDVPSKRNPILTHGSSLIENDSSSLRLIGAGPELRLFAQSSIVELRLLLLCTVILLTSPLTYQLLMGTSNLSMASFAHIPSTPMPGKTLTVPANNFSVISGSISGLADSSIYTNVDRVRAAMTSPVPEVVSASYYFKILGSSPTVLPDSDGVTRQGVVFWVNMHNACNLYFLFWRTDSTKPAGTTVVGAKVQVNPTITSSAVNHSDLIACAGVGYSTISQPDGTPAEISSNLNIMDGNWHNFTVVKLGPERWRLYTDGVFAFEAYDPANNFPIDSNLWGLRLDNVEIQLYYQLTISTSRLFSTSFTVQPPSGQTGQPISFSASALGGSPPYAYSWNFGDGLGSSTVQSPTYSYGSTGSYTVILLTRDSVGATATASNSVTIARNNNALTANISANTNNPQSEQTVLFTASAVGGTAPYTYAWNFGDGSTDVGAAPSHTYSSSGIFDVTVTVTDSNSQTTSGSQLITVSNPLPLFQFSVGFDYQPRSVTTATTVVFTTSVTGGTSPYHYQWDLGDGATSSGAYTSHLYAYSGTYTIQLTVTDNSGQSYSTSQTVTVIGSQIQPLTTDFNYKPTHTTVDTTVTFAAAATGGTGPYTFGWDLGDASTATGTNIDHMYTKASNYTVVLTTTDHLGDTTISSKTVSINPASTTQPPPPTQPPSKQPSGGICILCTTSRLISMLSLLTVGLIAGGFLSVGIFLSRYHAENRRLATALRRLNQANRTTPSLRVKRTKTRTKTRNREYRTLQGRVWANQ